MHRSGTSVATRLINLLGADISQDLLPPLPDNNERGFWESKALMVAHDKLLEALNSSWDGLFPLPQGWIATSAAQEARLAISKELDKFADSPLFIVKDPRLPRLLPLWLKLLDERGIEPVVVIPFRNPLEVALSLKRRDGFPVSKSMLIYARSNLEAELTSRGRKRVFVSYATLLSDWRLFAKRLREVVGPAIKLPRGQKVAEIESFLTTDLYHNRMTRDELARHPETGATVVTIYDRLSKAAVGADDASLRHSFDRLRDTVYEATRLFGGLVASEPQRSATTQAPRPSQDSAVSKATPDSVARDSHSGPTAPARPPAPSQSAPPSAGPSVRVDPAAHHALDLMAEARTDLARRLEEMSKRVASLDEMRLGLVKQLGQAESQKAELKAQRAEARLQQQASEIASLTKELAQARTSATELVAARDALKRQSQQQASHLDALAKELGTARSREAELQAAQDASRQRGDELQAEVQAAEAKAEEADKLAQRRLSGIEAMTEDLEAARASEAESQAAREALKRRVQNQASQIEALTQQVGQIEGLTKELEAVRASEAALRANRDEVTAQFEGAQAEIKNHKSKALEAEMRANRQALQIEGLAKDRDIARADEAELRLTRDALTKELEAAHSSSADLLATRDRLKRELVETQVRAQKSETGLQQAENRIQQQASRVEALNQELDNALAKNTELSTASEALREEVAASRAEAQQFQARAEHAEAHVQEQAYLVETLSRQIGTLRGSATELLAAREILKHQRADARAEARRSELKAEEAAARTEALANELEVAGAREAEFEAMQAALSRQIDEAQSGVRKFAARLQAAETRAQQREIQLEGLARKAEAQALQHEAQVESLTREIDILRGEVTQAPLERDREIEKVRSHLNQVIAARDQEHQGLRAELNRLASERERDVEAVQTNWSQVVAERDQEIETLRTNLEQMGLQHERTVRALTETVAWRIAAPVRKTEEWVMNRRQRREVRLIMRSGLFDRGWYLAQYPDVAASGLDPLEHFLTWGAEEGRDPGPGFDTQWYLSNNADVQAAGINPLLHYVTRGAAEGRRCRPSEPTPAADSAIEPAEIAPPVVAEGKTASEMPAADDTEDAPSGRVRTAKPAEPLRVLKSVEAAQTDVAEPIHAAKAPLRAPEEQTATDLEIQAEIISESGFFDPEWYLRQYPDVAAAAYSPLQHFLNWGAAEGRNPSPEFDTARYLSENPEAAESGMNPLLHYLLRGAKDGRAPGVRSRRSPRVELRRPLPPTAKPRQSKPQTRSFPSVSSSGGAEFRSPAQDEPRSQPSGLLRPVPAPENKPEGGAEPTGDPASSRSSGHGDQASRGAVQIVGGLRRQDGQPTVLLCAHAAGTGIYGSERSLLDLLDGFAHLGYNAVVTVPKRKNHLYIDEIKKRSLGVYFFRYDWWTKAAPVDEAIDTFCAIIAANAVDVVHANTIMLREPLIAARRMNIKSIVHAREVIHFDAPLCEFIGESSREIVARVLDSADHIVANSAATARCFKISDERFVIPNCVDVDLFNIPNEVDPKDVRVALISSNIPKKGMFDLVDIARRLGDLPARFLLIGPENEFIAQLKSAQAVGALPKNVQLTGYSPSPVDAVAQANIVVNLSHFQESFGRSVLEALAARRPVIAYDWGAVSELVVDGKNGFLVPFLDTERAAERLRHLCSNPSLITSLGEEGRAGAAARYGKDAYAEKIRQAYALVLEPGVAEVAAAVAKAAEMPRISVVIPNFNYARHLPARIQSIARQTLAPCEIIFLDDVSTDDSVAIAKDLLEKTGIPFRMIVNETNRGTYRQWLTGIEEATGDFIWIAEADDDCDPDFLSSLLARLEDPNVAIAYSQSRRIDDEGRVTAPTNLLHTDDVSKDKWLKDYVEVGARETVDALAFRNTIPNVSACVFRKDALLAAGPGFAEFQSCGDWLLYAQILKHAKIAYIAKPLNAFRRHSGSSTRKRERSTEFLDELLRVREFICSNFPLHQRQLPLLKQFLDKDYRIEGVAKPSESPACVELESRLAAMAASRRRIGFVTTNNGSYFGGSEMLWQEAALQLAGAGHDVAVLIKEWAPRPDVFEAFDRAGIKMHFKERNGFEGLLAFAPDLTIVSLGDQDEGTDYFKGLQQAGLPYVILNQLTKEERFWPIRANKAADVKSGYLGAERVFFTCRNNHRVMEERLSCSLPNWDVHYNPFHIDRALVPPFPPLDEGLKLALPAKLLFIHKGQDILVEVLKDEKWKARNLVFNIYGIGPDRERLEQMARDYGVRNLVFHGRVPDIGDIWRDNHALILPSRMEGMPIMLISALLCARVPIVTNIGGHAEVVDDGVTGFIAATPSVEALDQALDRAYAARQDWEEIGRRARARVLTYLPDDPVGDFVQKILPLARRATGAEPPGQDVKQTAPI